MEKYIFHSKDLPSNIDGDGVEAYIMEKMEAYGYVIVSAGWKKGGGHDDYYEVVCEPNRYTGMIFGVRDQYFINKSIKGEINQ